MGNALKILAIGNSFAVDTMKHLANLAASLGIETMRFGILYIGGCSINKHLSMAESDAKAYVYYNSNGGEWEKTEGVSIREAMESDVWDWISIQHGTGDGSRYTSEESYENLPSLIAYVKNRCAPTTRIAFNMAWVMESYSHHHEIVSYDQDPLKMYEKLTELTERLILPMKDLDVVSPAGTAIQNARTTALADRLSRDGFHLSLGIGRYIAGLTFLKALTGISVDNVNWMPEDMTEEERAIAIRAANSAIEAPFQITNLST